MVEGISQTLRNSKQMLGSKRIFELSIASLLIIGILSVLAIFLNFSPGMHIWPLLVIGLLATTFFIGNPFYLLLLYLAAQPFSYLVRADPETSILVPTGALLILLAVPCILATNYSLKLRLSSLELWITLFLLGCFLSIFPSAVPESAIKGFIFFIGNCLFYIICLKLVDTLKKAKLIIWTMCTTFGIAATLGLVERVVTGGLRVYGVVGEPNYFALLLMPFAFIALYQFWYAKRLWQRIYFGYLFLCSALVTIFSLSRAAMIVFPIVAIVAFIRNKKWKQLLIVLAIMAVLFFIVFPEWMLRGLHLIELLSPRRVYSIQMRWGYLLSGLNMFLNHPIFGVGAGCVRRVFPQYRVEDIVHVAASEAVTHNTYVEILASTGLVGFIPFLGIIYSSLRNYRKAVIKFDRIGEKSMSKLVEGIGFGFVAYLMGILFLTWPHHVVFWLLIAFSSLLDKFSHGEQ